LRGIFSNEKTTLRHLPRQKPDGFDVRLDFLQRFSVVNELKDVIHHACQANNLLVVILLV
jgi:hypothetical protein